MQKLYEHFQIFHFQKRIVSAETIREIYFFIVKRWLFLRTYWYICHFLKNMNLLFSWPWKFEFFRSFKPANFGFWVFLKIHIKIKWKSIKFLSRLPMWTRLKRISSVIFVITPLMPNDTFWITKLKFTTNINMFATSVEKDSGK